MMSRKIALTLFAACALGVCAPTKTEAMIQSHHYYMFPAYYQFVTSVSHTGGMIEITDESGWEVDSMYRFEASSWRKGDRLLISPTSIPRKFYITNADKNDRFVVANLVAGPVKTNPNRTVIVSLSHRAGFIEVRSQKGELIKWSANPADSYTLDRWKVGDKIIVGANDDFWAAHFSDYHSILINVTRYPSYVRTKLY